MKTSNNHRFTIRNTLPFTVSILVLLAISGVLSLNTVGAQEPGPARCNLVTPLGGGLASCPDPASIGYNGTFDPGNCYEIIMGSGVQVTNKPCTGPPFADDFISVACRDGTNQTGNGKTPDELCEGHDGPGVAVRIKCADGTSQIVSKTVEHQGRQDQLCDDHGGTQAAVDDASDAIKNPDRLDCTGADCISNNPIVLIAKAVINFMNVVVGVLVVAVIVWSGILYASAGGNPGKTAEAKNRIINAIIALVMYIFLFAFLQWLVPGGVLG